MIAALYVHAKGVYAGFSDVDLWPEDRDARKYPGHFPVVAHPPCARWGRYWSGGPSAPGKHSKGDDGGCFAAALDAVRKWGGVIEHPAASYAWSHFGLLKPMGVGWSVADWCGGWTCEVEQGWYGHRARKKTWLYAVGAELPQLHWGSAPGSFDKIDFGFHSKEDRRRSIGKGAVARLSKHQGEATPIAFRDVLIDIARSVRR